MSTLFSIGKYQFLTFIQNWLTLSELSLLDSSVCNTKQRIIFIDVIASKIICLNGSEFDHVSETLINWIFMRQLRVNKLVFNNHMFEKVLKNSFDVTLIDGMQFGYCWKENEENMSHILKKLPNLLKLGLSYSPHIGDEFFSNSLVNSKSLLDCSLVSLNNITDKSVCALSDHCKLLQAVNLNNCTQITGKSICALANECRDLMSVSISGCGNVFGDCILRLAENCTRLTAVNISYNHFISPNAVSALVTQCPGITSLHMGHCSNALTDVTLSRIATHCGPRLQSLNIAGSKNITDGGVAAMCDGCRNITELDISLLYNTTIISIVTVANILLQLRDVRFNQSDNANKRAMAIFSAKMHSLTVIDTGTCRIAGNPRLKCLQQKTDLFDPIIQRTLTARDKSIVRLLPQCGNLTSLTLHIKETRASSLGVLTSSLFKVAGFIKQNEADSELFLVASHCRQLRYLNIADSRTVSDEGLAAVVTSNPLLTHIDCRRCRMLTDISVEAIASGCPRLRELNLLGCSGVSDRGITALSWNCPDLTSLNVSECSEVTHHALQKVVDSCRGLNVMRFRDTRVPPEFGREFRERYGME